MDTTLTNYLVALYNTEEAQAILEAIEAEKAQAVNVEGFDAFCAELDAMDDDNEV
jgi:hypothetical protein